jgi:hypothetical protein
MTAKEFVAFGKALKALIEVGAIDKAKEIIDFIADEKPLKDKDDGKE